MRVFAYIRVSTEMQTYANQEYEILRYCKRHDLVVTKWISESVSGTVEIDKRRLGKTISKMRRGDLLICTELSRLGRNMLMIMGVLNECSARGIAIHTIKDNFDLSESINSKIIAFAFALAAEIERNLISQRTREALAVRKARGMRLGRPPGSSKKKVLFCKQADEVRRMIAEGKSLSEVANLLGIHRNTLRKYVLEMKLTEMPESLYKSRDC